MHARRRKVEVVVISDVHLGTFGCHARELLLYLRSIQPRTVILNGDIIDIWQFSKRYWPKAHMKVIKQLVSWMTKRVKIFYIPGNHDEVMRKFSGMKIGSLKIVDKLLLELDGSSAWFFHGDVFDVTMQHSKWLAKMGAIGYDTLILINRFANFVSERVFKRGKLSLSKRIKHSVKTAIKFIGNFEQTAADIAIFNKYRYVACGHIHQPEIREISNQHGTTVYLNSGDWIENLTALEYNQGKWSLYRFDESQFQAGNSVPEDEDASTAQLFSNLVSEFNAMKIS